MEVFGFLFLSCWSKLWLKVDLSVPLIIQIMQLILEEVIKLYRQEGL